MSRMTLIQLVSRMPPEVGAAYMRLGEVLCEMAATLLTRGDSTLPCALVVAYPCGCVRVIRVASLLESASELTPEAAAPSSDCEPDCQLTPSEMLEQLDTRWGIS